MVQKLRYLTKFPIEIKEKKHSKLNNLNGKYTHYKSVHTKAFASQYGYFQIDKGGNVNFIITLKDNKRRISYTIRIAKQYIYDSMILNCMGNPIRRTKERNATFWVNKNVKKDMPLSKLNDELDAPEIYERFNDVQNSLMKLIGNTNSVKRKRDAELQLDKLMQHKWKMDILNEICNGYDLINE